MAGLPGISMFAPQLQNATPGQDIGSFLSSLAERKKKNPRVTAPGEQQIGTSQNSALYGGNMLSPAFSAILKAFG